MTTYYFFHCFFSSSLQAVPPAQSVKTVFGGVKAKVLYVLSNKEADRTLSH